MLYVDDAGTVSKSAEGLAKMMTVSVTVFEAAELTDTAAHTRPGAPTSPVVVEAAGQRYVNTIQFLCPGGLVNANADIMPEIKRRNRLAWAYRCAC